MNSADPALPTALHLVLLALLILGASVWIGGMAAVTMLSVTSRSTLQPEDRSRLFRDFGRRYLAVAGPALVVTVVCGAVLLIARGWDGLATAIAVLVGVLVLALIVGVRQARAIGRLRRAIADGVGTAESGELDARARHARVLRALLGAVSAAIFVLAICTAA